MKNMPDIGTQVTFKKDERKCSGVVVAQYAGGEECSDPETGEHWIAPHYAGVQVDKPLPDWWSYPGTDRFAPEIRYLKEQ